MEKIIIKIIGLCLWALSAIAIFNSYKGIIYVSTNAVTRWIMYLIFIAVSPILVLNTIITMFLDLILPEGWIIGDDEFFDQEEKDDDDDS